MITELNFERKPSCLRDVIKGEFSDEPERFKIVKVIKLTEKGFNHFSQNLLWDTQFIRDHSDLMRYNEDCTMRYCILVKGDKTSPGLIIDSQGHGYARHVAYVNDCKNLDLEGVSSVRYSDERAKATVHIPKHIER